MTLLTAVLAMLAGLASGGPVLVAALALGLHGWPAILLALGVGLLGGAALAAPIEAEMKRLDPAWDEVRDRPHPLAPHPSATARPPARSDRSSDPRLGSGHGWRR